MSLNIKKSFFIKQSAKDNNINNKPNKSLTLQKKNDLLDYATLKKNTWLSTRFRFASI